MNRLIACAAGATLLIGGLAGCTSSADKVSTNISKEAEAFKVQRRIVGINGITDKILFSIEGKCSIENTTAELQVVCKQSPSSYTKTVVGLADNVTYVSTQVEGIKVSEYRTKIILKPENIVPDFDLQTGE